MSCWPIRPDFFLLVDNLLAFFSSDLGSGGRKKSSENDQSTGHIFPQFLLRIQKDIKVK